MVAEVRAVKCLRKGLGFEQLKFRLVHLLEQPHQWRSSFQA